MNATIMSILFTHLHGIIPVILEHVKYCVWRYNPGGPNNTLYICHWLN